MLHLIETEGAKGILCWKLNRLFRNPKDEGTVRWLLQNGQIEEIVTPGKTYKEADSDFSMAVEGAQAQRFIRDLKEDTARGIQRKLDKGVAPIHAPPGYKNDTHLRQGDKTISPHPVYFDLLKEIFDLAIGGNYSVESLYKKAKEMGIKNSSGRHISKTQMYKLLRNPFYKGSFLYAGKLYSGSHEPLISNEEYDITQNVLDGRAKTSTIQHQWVLTGLLKCGICGRQITAEKHVKKSGREFSYYKCTGKYKNGCTQVYVPLQELEDQAFKYLGKIQLSPEVCQMGI
jgi:site-specific DNA recombinase